MSRTRARELITTGRVSVDGTVCRRPSTSVGGQLIEVHSDDDADFASRGGHKLSGALEHWPQLSIRRRRCLDAGASTGGFTDVLLRAGAWQVVAVDVGANQLRPHLAADSRVVVHDRCNVRTLTADQIGGPVDVTVCDLSFISLTLVLDALTACTKPDGDLVAMVKPQFEVGRERLGRNGVVRSHTDRISAVAGVAHRAAALGWGTRAVRPSPLPGPAGNVEYFLWLRRDADPPDEAVIAAAVVTGGRCQAQ